MIANAHPMLAVLSESPFTFHLIGSRYVGVFTEKSDYDFLGIVQDYATWAAFKLWLTDHKFAVQHPNQYGPDRRLYGGDVWTWSDAARAHPSVDVLPVSPEEAAFRLRWFATMKAVDNESGLIAKGQKAEKAWPLLWDVLAKFEAP